MADADFSKGAKIERLERNLRDPTPALKVIGTFMVAESQRAFSQQSFGGAAWLPRRVPNIMGIIGDFAAGKSAPPERRFEARPALRDTGRLAGSISFSLGPDYVDVGSNVEYAAVHQRGGETKSAPITDEVRRGLWQWLRTQSRERKRMLGWLLNKKFRGKQLTGHVPARPFLGITDKTRAFARRALAVELMEAGP